MYEKYIPMYSAYDYEFERHQWSSSKKTSVTSVFVSNVRKTISANVVVLYVLSIMISLALGIFVQKVRTKK